MEDISSEENDKEDQCNRKTSEAFTVPFLEDEQSNISLAVTDDLRHYMPSKIQKNLSERQRIAKQKFEEQRKCSIASEDSEKDRTLETNFSSRKIIPPESPKYFRSTSVPVQHDTKPKDKKASSGFLDKQTLVKRSISAEKSFSRVKHNRKSNAGITDRAGKRTVSNVGRPNKEPSTCNPRLSGRVSTRTTAKSSKDESGFSPNSVETDKTLATIHSYADTKSYLFDRMFSSDRTSSMSSRSISDTSSPTHSRTEDFDFGVERQDENAEIGDHPTEDQTRNGAEKNVESESVEEDRKADDDADKKSDAGTYTIIKESDEYYAARENIDEVFGVGNGSNPDTELTRSKIPEKAMKATHSHDSEERTSTHSDYCQKDDDDKSSEKPVQDNSLSPSHRPNTLSAVSKGSLVKGADATQLLQNTSAFLGKMERQLSPRLSRAVKRTESDNSRSTFAQSSPQLRNRLRCMTHVKRGSLPGDADSVGQLSETASIDTFRSICTHGPRGSIKLNRAFALRRAVATGVKVAPDSVRSFSEMSDTSSNMSRASEAGSDYVRLPAIGRGVRTSGVSRGEKPTKTSVRSGRLAPIERSNVAGSKTLTRSSGVVARPKQESPAVRAVKMTSVKLTKASTAKSDALTAWERRKNYDPLRLKNADMSKDKPNLYGKTGQPNDKAPSPIKQRMDVRPISQSRHVDKLFQVCDAALITSIHHLSANLSTHSGEIIQKIRGRTLVRRPTSGGYPTRSQSETRTGAEKLMQELNEIYQYLKTVESGLKTIDQGLSASDPSINHAPNQLKTHNGDANERKDLKRPFDDSEEYF